MFHEMNIFYFLLFFLIIQPSTDHWDFRASTSDRRIQVANPFCQNDKRYNEIFFLSNYTKQDKGTMRVRNIRLTRMKMYFIHFNNNNSFYSDSTFNKSYLNVTLALYGNLLLSSVGFAVELLLIVIFFPSKAWKSKTFIEPANNWLARR